VHGGRSGISCRCSELRNQLPKLGPGSAIDGAAAQIPGLVDRSVLRVKNFLADLNERLEKVSFVAGEQFSAADITALVIFCWPGLPVVP
jgi:glutathione S-transferase